MLIRIFSFSFCLVLLTSSYVGSRNLFFDLCESELTEEVLVPNQLLTFILPTPLIIVAPTAGEIIKSRLTLVPGKVESKRFHFFNTDLPPPHFHS